MVGAVRRWISLGLSPADLDAPRARRIDRVRLLGSLALLTVITALVFAMGERFDGGATRFAIAVATIFVPLTMFRQWAARRGPAVRAAGDMSSFVVIAAFTAMFSDLRPLAPYAYLFSVALTSASYGATAAVLACAAGVAGSLVAWPAELSAPLHRVGFWGLLGTTAGVIVAIGRERNEAARLARKSAERMKEAQDLAHVGSWYWDLERDEVVCSEELAKIIGVPAEQAGTRAQVLRHVHPDDRASMISRLDEARLTKEAFSLEIRVVRPSGEARIVLAKGRVVAPRDGPAIAFVGTGQDITDQRRADEAMREALSREREASDRLRALSEMKSSFLTAVSHELRTPLTAVIGFARTLERPNRLSPQQQMEMLKRLSANAEKLGRLLSDLLDIDRLERGIIEPCRRPADLAELVRNVAEDGELAERRPLELDLTSVVIAVDAPKVERIVENLVANALKYTPDGTPLWIRVEPAPDGALVTVEDAGPGVPANLRAEVFEPFRQGRSLSHSPGVGIGLSLVARFAELHGGRAWVEERPGGGARFRVLLRAADELEISSRDAQGKPRSGGAAGVTRSPRSGGAAGTTGSPRSGGAAGTIDREDESASA